jgi:hypothetical protein
LNGNSRSIHYISMAAHEIRSKGKGNMCVFKFVLLRPQSFGWPVTDILNSMTVTALPPGPSIQAKQCEGISSPTPSYSQKRERDFDGGREDGRVCQRESEEVSLSIQIFSSESMCSCCHAERQLN